MIIGKDNILHTKVDKFKVPATMDGNESMIVAAIKNREHDLELALARLNIALVQYEKQYGDKK